MKGFRRFTAIAIGAGVITIGLAVSNLPRLPVSGLAAASVVRADDGCSLASLRGPYAVAAQGTVVAQLRRFPAPPAPYAESSLAYLDGAGTFPGKATLNVGGVVVKPTFT